MNNSGRGDIARENLSPPYVSGTGENCRCPRRGLWDRGDRGAACYPNPSELSKLAALIATLSRLTMVF